MQSTSWHGTQHAQHTLPEHSDAQPTCAGHKAACTAHWLARHTACPLHTAGRTQRHAPHILPGHTIYSTPLLGGTQGGMHSPPEAVGKAHLHTPHCREYNGQRLRPASSMRGGGSVYSSH
jgi:hypothetical protein